MSDRLAEIKARLEGISPWPWAADWRYEEHGAGSPSCIETCGRGKQPDCVRHEGTRYESHSFRTTIVEEVLGANGQHVVCFGHDYDDYGSVGDEDGAFIAEAPSDIAWLVSEVERLRAVERAVSESWEESKATIAATAEKDPYE